MQYLTNEVTTLKVETVQFVASLFGIHDILVNHECRAFRVVRNTLTDLTR
jgi:hypothetical protein